MQPWKGVNNGDGINKELKEFKKLEKVIGSTKNSSATVRSRAVSNKAH